MKWLIAIVVLCALPVFAGSVYFFDVRATNDVVLSEAKDGTSTNACQDSGNILIYRVVVTPQEFTNGWTNVPQAKKDAAKAAAELERSDFTEKFEKILRAFAEVVRKEINRVKANPTTTYPTNTIQQLKTAVRNEYNKL